MPSASVPGTVPTLPVLSKHAMLESMFCAKNRCPSLPATHKPCLATAQDGVEMMQILDAIYKSASTGHKSYFKGVQYETCSIILQLFPVSK